MKKIPFEERPLWDPERGLMTADEHYDYLQEERTRRRKEEEAILAELRAAGNLFNIEDVDAVFSAELHPQGLQLWEGRRLRNAFLRACHAYWPKEWASTRPSSWVTDYELPAALRHGRTIPETLRLLVGHCFRTHNARAAVRNFLLKPQAFLEREERHLVRRRLAR